MPSKRPRNTAFDWMRPRNWGIVQVYRDFENFADWRRVIKREEDDKSSKYSLWKLSRSRLYDVYKVVTLDDSDAGLPEEVQRTKVAESMNPVHRYLDEELGFAECLDVEFNQFEDDAGKPTLSYLIVYRFAFNRFSVKWLAKNLVFWGAVAFVVLRFGLVSKLATWISSLI